MSFWFVNRISIDAATGRAMVADSAPSGGDPTLGGFRFSDNATTLYIQTGAVPGNAVFMDGFAFNPSNGRLCALIDSPPASNARFYNDGILGDAAGHMCMTANNAIANYQHGWPVDSIGQVCITGGSPPPPVTTIDKIVIIWSVDAG